MAASNEVAASSGHLLCVIWIGNQTPVKVGESFWRTYEGIDAVMEAHRLESVARLTG